MYKNSNLKDGAASLLKHTMLKTETLKIVKFSIPIAKKFFEVSKLHAFLQHKNGRQFDCYTFCSNTTTLRVDFFLFTRLLFDDE